MVEQRELHNLRLATSKWMRARMQRGMLRHVAFLAKVCAMRIRGGRRSAILLACTLFPVLALPILALEAQQPLSPDGITVVIDSKLAAPVEHSVRLLRAALDSQGLKAQQQEKLRDANGEHVLVIGLCSVSPSVQTLVRQAQVRTPHEAEALLVQNVLWNGRHVVVICGADGRGLMYAVYDITEQIRLASDGHEALARIPDTVESPDVEVRSVTRMLMNRAVVEEYFYSEDYWDAYLTMLARNRYNTFTLMMGYGAAGYFEPPYPFLFDVPGFPDVRVAGLTNAEQQRNLQMLNRIIEMTHARGLDFTLALWTHIFVPGRNNSLSEARSSVPAGLTEDNLLPYTHVALRRFLRLVPGIDRLQFRAHVESSVALPYQKQFWKEVFRVLEESDRRIPVDMRLKGLSDDLIELALESPLQVRLTTKHWGEEMGLPYHPTQDTLANKYKRRHTYADVLTYPRSYEMLWRLWSHGTVKVLLWGSPEHARRFAESTHLYDGVGFDLHEPLAMKMGYKRGLHDAKPYDVLSADYRHYEWEFERYWHYYQVFGRLGYNPRTPPRVWQAEFEHRFGKAAAPFVERAYAAASKVLPRIVAYATRDLSAGFTWPEKQRWEDLPDYIEVEPSDTAQFLGIEEAARLHLRGLSSAKITPQQNSEWFEHVSREILDHIREAERRAGPKKNREFVATMIDMRVLAHLASYHAKRLRAGLSYALFQETGDLHAMDDALEREREAITEWRNIVELTDGVYPDNIIMGREGRMTGSWKTELLALVQGLAALKQERAQFRAERRAVVARVDVGDGPIEEGFQPLTSTQRYSTAQGGSGWHHRNLKPAVPPADSAEKERYRDFLHGPPADAYADSSFAVDVPNGEYELLFSMIDRSPGADDHGPMWLVAEGKDATTRFMVPAGQLVETTLRTRVVDERLDVLVNSTTDGDWILNSLVVTRVEPAIGHVPIRRVSGDRDVTIRATISGPDPIRAADVTYGSETGGYRRVSMTSSGPRMYQAIVPRSGLVDDFRYFITVVDAAGRRVSLPRDGADHAFQVAVTTDTQAPQVTHEKVRSWRPGEALMLEARVSDESGVGPVYVRYRAVNQHQDFHRLRMLPTGRGNDYQAEIPGADVDGRWDFMYYIEAFDTHGNGRIYPDLEIETPYVVVDLHPTHEVTTTGSASLKR